MTAYDAIYLTETEHSLLDHSDVPGAAQSGASVAAYDWRNVYFALALSSADVAEAGPLPWDEGQNDDSAGDSGLTADLPSSGIRVARSGVYYISASASADDENSDLRLQILDSDDNVVTDLAAPTVQATESWDFPITASPITFRPSYLEAGALVKFQADGIAKLTYADLYVSPLLLTGP